MGGYFDANREVWDLDAHRPLSARELRERVARRDALDCIQISMSTRPRPGEALIATLREQFFAIRPELQLRIYGADKLDLGGDGVRHYAHYFRPLCPNIGRSNKGGQGGQGSGTTRTTFARCQGPEHASRALVNRGGVARSPADHGVHRYGVQ